jgi:hypothetical protein
MTVKRNVQRALRRLLCGRRGTAEIIGSVMFLLIMMFFFTNVFLWHDRATREMDGVLSEKMNSLVSIQVVSMNTTSKDMRLDVTNNGGVGVVLSRLWIITYDNHNYADLEKGHEIWVAAGDTIDIVFVSPTTYDAGGSYKVGEPIAEEVPVYYVPDGWVEVTFTILTTRGNMAACSSTPYE